MAKKQQKKIIYNYYDQEQVKAYYRLRQQIKKRRRRKIIAVLIVLILIVAFFISDYSRLQTITVSGNEMVTSDEIIAASKIQLHHDYTFFTNLDTAKEAIENTSLIQSATVKKNLFGQVTINVKEGNPVGQSYINGVLYVIGDSGRLVKNESGSLVAYVQTCPQISGFNEDILNEFASEFAKLPSQVINQISEVHYLGDNTALTRCEFLMDDGKILYVLYDDMAKQLANNNYSMIMDQFPDQKYYDFCGKYVYAYN